MSVRFVIFALSMCLFRNVREARMVACPKQVESKGNNYALQLKI